MISARERGWVRLGILAVAVGFLAQFAFAHHVDEPYPSITMPRFRGSAGHRKDRVKRASGGFALGFRDGSVAVVAQRDLLRRTLPVGGHNEVMRFLCGRAPAAEIPDWMLRMFPSYRKGRRDHGSPGFDASVRGWARREATVLFPGREVAWLECRRYRNVYRFGDDGVQRKQRLEATRRWELDG